ncbi:MAG: oxygenase MpaB family protein [Acidimicrobiales bacterium]
MPFGPGSATWQIDLEPSVVLGGGRALLMQVAHPLVAAGVTEHSDYERDPYGRLFGTLDVMMKMLFGHPDVSTRQRQVLSARHRRVQGVTADGTPYRASDPALLLWVWATLVDTAMLMYEVMSGALAEETRRQFYLEQRLLAHGCGVPDPECPPDLEAFRVYVASMVDSGLHITPAARTIAATVLAPPLPSWLIGAAPLNRLITTSLLPVRLRDGYGLAWNRRRELVSRAALGTLRGGIRLVPRAIRQRPLLAMARAESVRPPALLRRVVPDA